jgi:hypothetical protein
LETDLIINEAAMVQTRRRRVRSYLLGMTSCNSLQLLIFSHLRLSLVSHHMKQKTTRQCGQTYIYTKQQLTRSEPKSREVRAYTSKNRRKGYRTSTQNTQSQCPVGVALARDEARRAAPSCRSAPAALTNQRSTSTMGNHRLFLEETAPHGRLVSCNGFGKGQSIQIYVWQVEPC